MQNKKNNKKKYILTLVNIMTKYVSPKLSLYRNNCFLIQNHISELYKNDKTTAVAEMLL